MPSLEREPQGWRVNLANKRPIGNSREKHSKITNKRSLTSIRKVSNHLYNESKYHKISQSSIALNKRWSLESCNSLLIQNKNMQKKKKKNTLILVGPSNDNPRLLLYSPYWFLAPFVVQINNIKTSKTLKTFWILKSE